MARFEVTMANATVIANGEIITLRAATAWATAGSLLQVLRMTCGQNGTSTSQELSIRWGQKASAFGTFTSTTPAPLIVGAAASSIAGSTSNAASSCGTNASANGAGTFTAIGQEGFNNLNGWVWVPTPEERIFVAMDLTFLLQIQGTPTTLTGWNATLTFEQLT